MPPEKTPDTERRRSVLAPASASPKAGKDAKSRTAIEVFALGVGAASAAVLKSSDAEAGDAAFVGRNQYLDRIGLDTGVVTSSTPFGSSQAVLYGAQVIEPSSGNSYIILSVRDTVNGDKLIKVTDLDAVTPTLDVLTAVPVSVPKEIHVNPEENIFSLASGGTSEAIACTMDDPEVCERYSIDVSLSRGIIFDNTDGPTPTLISINSNDGTVRIYPLTADTNGDGFPEPSATGEVPSDIENLGTSSSPQAFHFDDATKVLTVGTLNDKQIHAMDLDTNSGTPSILTRYDTLFATLRPTDIVDTGTGGLVVLGHNGGGTGYRASFTIGVDASTLTPNIPEASFGGGSRVGNYQSGAMNSDGNLVVLHTNWDQLRTYDLSFNQIGGPFSTGGFGIENVIVVYQATPPPPSDLDGDGTPDTLDCAPSDPTTYPGAPELCDGVANDCEAPGVPTDEVDSDGDGITECEGDCNPGDSSVYPGAPEQCNGVSDDCDPEVDEDLTLIPSSPDNDGDGFGTNNPLAVVESCAVSGSNSIVMTDCDDANSAINPGAPEVCGGPDENCNGQQGEPGALGEVQGWPDMDDDTYGAAGVGTVGCPTAGIVGQDGDCNDSDASVHPNAPEYADGRDKDCDTHFSAAVGIEVDPNTDNTLIGNPGVPSENGPNYIQGLGQSVNVKFTEMARQWDEILEETYEVLGYQIVDSSEVGQLRVSREAGGEPIYVYQRPDSAGPDFIPTWTAAVTGTVLEVLDQPNGTARLSVIEGTSVALDTEFYNDDDLWAAYEEANPEAGGNPLLLSNPGDWAEIDKATGEILDSNVDMIEAFLDFVEEYEQGDDDSAPDDDDSDDDDTEDDDDETPDDDDETPNDDDSTEEILDDDSDTSGDDDSAVEEPGCQESGCSMTIQNFDSNTNVRADLSPMFTMTAILLMLAARVRRWRRAKEWAGQ